MGTIYEIICWTTGLRYVGQTTQKLSYRFSDHKSCYKTKHSPTTAYLVLEHGNCDIYELEKVEDKDLLSDREKYHIQHTDCVNAYDGSFNSKEWSKENSKKYYYDNKEIISEKSKEYYEANREDILERVSRYRKNNDEKIKDKWKIWYETNKEKISEKGKEKYKCGCGSTLRKAGKADHERTKLHLAWLATQA